MATFNVYTDPGHGWIKVKKQLLVELGIADKITRYSYMRGEYAYLEEDVDAGTLLNALAAKGVTVKMNTHFGNKRSRIRDYFSYEAPATPPAQRVAA